MNKILFLKREEGLMKTNTYNFFNTVRQWTEELVSINSVNGTFGELEIVDKVESILRSFPYFQAHPTKVWTKEIKGDSLRRKSIFGVVTGEKAPSNRTVLLHCHTDTVTIDDYGDLKAVATKPEELMKKLRGFDLPPDVAADLDSGDWYFGRGTVDMKSGIASHLTVLKYLSEHRDTFSGNILFMANPIEETTHGGVIDALSELERLKVEAHYEYVTAINADFVGPLYLGDTTRYIYTGSVGKLLPSFYIKGKETHVGQPFEGFDPNLVASEIVKNINLNMSLVDEAEGEMTLPPVALKVEDLKPTYNVQTPFSSFVYFNYFVHERSPQEVMNQLKGIAVEAFYKVIDYLNLQFSVYSQVINRQTETLPWKARVVTYKELLEKLLEEKGNEVYQRLQQVIDENHEKKDVRIVARLLVEELLKMDSDQSPVIVIFFSPPYVPHNFVKDQTNNEKNVLKKLNATLQEVEEDTGHHFEVKKFFPSLTDSSYLSMDDSEDDIHYLKCNFPAMEKLYPIPIHKIKRLNIPSINLGTWGKDAHKMLERVFMPYTFQVLPELTVKLTIRLLNEQNGGVYASHYD